MQMSCAFKEMLILALIKTLSFIFTFNILFWWVLNNLIFCPYSQVFIPWALSLRVSKIFECIGRGMERGCVPKRGKQINYESLALGSLKEVRHLFARIVFDTIYPPHQNRDKHIAT